MKNYYFLEKIYSLSRSLLRNEDAEFESACEAGPTQVSQPNNNETQFSILLRITDLARLLFRPLPGSCEAKNTSNTTVHQTYTRRLGFEPKV